MNASAQRNGTGRPAPATIVCVLGIAAVGLLTVRSVSAQGSEIEAVHVQGNVWMLVTPDGNLALQVGEQGALLVDTGRDGTSDVVLAAVRDITTRPLRFIINTSASSNRVGNNAAFRVPAGSSEESGAPEVIARESVLFRMTQEDYPPVAWPTDAYLEPVRNIRFNGEAIDVIHQPSAFSDGDSLVYFRTSDVIVAGEIYSTERFPLVDLEHGGTVQGVLAGLNRILDIAVPDLVQGQFAEGGTLVIPGSGRLSDQDDVTEYRDMVHIVRDRVADLVSMGRTNDEVRAAKPLVDYEGRYGTPEWTASMFLEALYTELAR